MFRRAGRQSDGQALVEFSLILVPFIVLMMGFFDLGRGIYMMNSTAEAAREIARVTVVHPWNSSKDLGSSSQVQAVIATQRGLVPNLQITSATDIVCVDILDAVQPDAECRSRPDRFVRVRVQAPFSPVTPVVSLFGSHTFESYSRIDVP
ncbi:MAG: TadE/TadG family type IV pilus assembly protein [Candidatus Limnocylindrales bacterium]